jgi:chromatin structure-remodeling complex subunit RSC1/2
MRRLIPCRGYDPTKLFQRKVNKRAVPDYYDIIKEPMALSTIKSKVAQREYKSFAGFVRDLALIPHNAQVYNRQDSQAYVDALDVKKVVLQELQRLVDEKVIPEAVASLPYLGEIPEQDPLLPEEEEEDDEEEDEEELEVDEEEEDDEEDEGKRKRRRGARSTAAISKREGRERAKADEKADDPESRKKRGRPPRVDTPMEARIKTIMKGIRKPRNKANKLMVSAFERVPDKAVMPEYHAEIKNPMAMDILKRKLKRKKYNSVDHFMVDVELMFENAKQYNEEESQIYQDAVHLQKEARKIAKAEKEKPDTDFVMEEGRIPMPNGILHNGELWKVGDWVHIQNANDLTKPIVAQIYRTWQDADGGKWVNACWYYRPEQTVHRFDRHFLENEVVKTGQYRDHRIDEVVDRCFVMFVTRYNKGRPRDFPQDKEIYVCEARYNEENHKLNKIKTWASCLPDEVRDKDYVMDLFDAPRKLKKNPSPIAYMLKDEQKEDDDLPKPEWGAENAPPKIGAVHRRPRDPKVSPHLCKINCEQNAYQIIGLSTSRAYTTSSPNTPTSTCATYPKPTHSFIARLRLISKLPNCASTSDFAHACAYTSATPCLSGLYAFTSHTVPFSLSITRSSRPSTVRSSACVPTYNPSCTLHPTTGCVHAIVSDAASSTRLPAAICAAAPGWLQGSTSGGGLCS